MPIPRRNSESFHIGRVGIGGEYPVSIQSMTTTDTRDSAATLGQIERLHKLGCEIIRCAVPDEAAATALARITAASPIPVVADIHFDHRLALAAMRNGAAAIRLNPGNLNGDAELAEVAREAVRLTVPIRVGANSGSLRPAMIEKHQSAGMDHEAAIAEALVESALAQCEMLERYGVTMIKAALKSSSVPVTVEACRRFAARTAYPLHIGVTEAGIPARGVIKSAVGIGTLLLEGIGDTMRVSLTADPAEEVVAARRILESCGLRDAMPEIISCPTCGRTEVDLIHLAHQVEDLIAEIKGDGHSIQLRKIAVMGCAVNGPGEAREADLGMAGGKNGKVVIFKFGEVVGAFDTAAGMEFFRMEILNNSRRRSSP